MKKSVILLFVLVATFATTFAQNTKEKKADRLVALYNYADAAKLYKEVVDKEGSTRIMAKLGYCYQLLKEYQLANYWYDKAYEFEINSTNELNNYVEILKTNKRYDKAKQTLRKYKELVPNYEEKIAKIDKTIALYHLDSAYSIMPVSINSDNAEFAPMFYQKGIIFAAEKNLSNEDEVFKWNNKSYLDLYYSEKRNSTTELTNPEPVKGLLNSDFHEAGSTITADDNTLYFTRNFYNNGKKSYSKDNTLKLEILEATRVGDKWKVTKPFVYNNKNYSVGHPFFNEKQNQLYFISDMPGGYGGTDIYVCEKLGDSWGQPINLGPKINSEKNEMFPFIGSDSVLYFSSEGHIGLGGLDIFKSTTDNGKNWNNPINLGIGINSDKDDFSFILDKDKRTGYFASNRDGGKGSDDLYFFESRAPKEFLKDTVLTLAKAKKETKTKNNFIDYTVKVEDEETGIPLKHVSVTLFDDTDNTSQTTNTNEDGQAIFKINPDHTFTVRINKEGYLNSSKNQVSGSDPNAGNISMYKKELNKSIVIKHIYYPFNKSVITPESANRLDILVNLMRENPDIEVELSSHTDSRASDAYNLKLSNERAQSAVEYIISRGIKRSRIFAKGYGESKLINKCKNGENCNEWEHAQNRRTEFKIIGLNGGVLNSSK